MNSLSEAPKSRLGFFSLLLLVVTNIIGGGIFTTSGYIFAELRQPWLLLAVWAAGGVLALTGALCYAEDRKSVV